MTSLTHTALSYTSYLRLVRATERDPEDVGLDIYGERMLHFLAHALYAGRRVTVVQAMQQVPGVSARTVHRRLQELQSDGLIAVRPSHSDQRVKFVTLTANALALFERRGQLLSLVGIKTQAASGSDEQTSGPPTP